MNKMGVIMKKFVEIYDIWMLLLVLFIGFFLLLRDVPQLRKKKLLRDMKVAKVLGYIYLIGGSILFIVAKTYRP